MDKVEKGLAAFLAAYNPFLDKMAQFATPIFSGLLAKAQKVPEDQRKTNQELGAATEKAFSDLEAKAQDFSNKSNALPVPEGAKVIKTQPCGWPLTDLYVFRLNYDAFVLTFSHTNKEIALGEQLQAGLSGSAIPGSTLDKDVSLWLRKPAVPTWEYVKPQLLKTRYDTLVFHNSSEKGHVEVGRTHMAGKFWSPGAWDAGKESQITTDHTSSRGLNYAITGVEFPLEVIGTGELDAFLQYAASATPTEAKK